MLLHWIASYWYYALAVFVPVYAVTTGLVHEIRQRERERTLNQLAPLKRK